MVCSTVLTLYSRRRTKRCTYSGRWDDDAATGDGHISPLSPPDLSLYDVDVKMQNTINASGCVSGCNPSVEMSELVQFLFRFSRDTMSDSEEKAHDGILHRCTLPLLVPDTLLILILTFV